jgi:TolB protein
MKSDLSTDERLYRAGVEALQKRRWQDAIDAFEPLVGDKGLGYRDARDKLKEARFRKTWALILDPFDSIRPRRLSLWQFIGLIFGVGVLTVAILCLTGVGIWLLPKTTPTPTEVVIAATTVPTAQISPPSSTPPTVRPTSPAPELTVTSTSEATVIPTPEVTPTFSETPTQKPGPMPTPSPTPTPTPTPTLSGKIAFPVYDPKRDTYDIYLTNTDGSNRRMLVEEASEPAISPDGSKIAFRSWNASTLGLMVRNIDGTQPQRVSRGLEDASPCWAQGESLVFHSTREGSTPRLYTAGTWGGADGTNNVQDVMQGKNPVHGQYPAWISDARIVYKYFDQAGNYRGLYVINADGSNPRSITDDIGDTMPSVPPRGGDKAAFMSNRTGKWEVYVVNIDGTRLRRLTYSHGYNSGLPTWSPDGNYVAFVSDRDNQWAVWVINADRSGERKLFDFGGPWTWGERIISWAP